MFENNEVFEALTALVDAWKGEQNINISAPLTWSEKDGDGMLFLNDTEICPIVLVDLENLSYDDENIWIGLEDGDEVRINFEVSVTGKVSFFIVP